MSKIYNFTLIFKEETWKIVSDVEKTYIFTRRSSVEKDKRLP